MNPRFWALNVVFAFALCLVPAFSAEAPDGSTVDHRSFDTNDPTVYKLRKFNGKYTCLQLSQGTLDHVGMPGYVGHR